MLSARPIVSAASVLSAAGLAATFLLGMTGCGSADSTHHRPSLHALAARYLAIAEPANRRLDTEVDAYTDHAHENLAAAAAALRAQAATERAFDRQLARIPFPARIAATARALISVNEIRAALAEHQARARSIPALLALRADHKSADAEVEAQVRVIRAQLGLPPPETS